MNSKYTLQLNSSGRFFVLGSGFTASTEGAASSLTASQVVSANSLGYGPTTSREIKVKSFAVNYVRPANRAKNYNGRNIVNADNNNPSKKRFATLGEAFNHGGRNLEANGHVGFWVTETNDAVTHYVSVKEDPKGLTCPIDNK